MDALSLFEICGDSSIVSFLALFILYAEWDFKVQKGKKEEIKLFCLAASLIPFACSEVFDFQKVQA